MPAIRSRVPVPAPGSPVWVFRRRPVHPLASILELDGQAVGQVEVVGPQGFAREQGPQALIRQGPAHNPSVEQDPQLPDDLLVKLQEPADLVPQVHAVLGKATLEQVPLVPQEVLDVLEVVPLEVVERRVVPLLQVPQGHVSTRRGGTTGWWSPRVRGRPTGWWWRRRAPRIHRGTLPHGLTLPE